MKKDKKNVCRLCKEEKNSLKERRYPSIFKHYYCDECYKKNIESVYSESKKFLITVMVAMIIFALIDVFYVYDKAEGPLATILGFIGLSVYMMNSKSFNTIHYIVWMAFIFPVFFDIDYYDARNKETREFNSILSMTIHIVLYIVQALLFVFIVIFVLSKFINIILIKRKVKEKTRFIVMGCIYLFFILAFIIGINLYNDYAHKKQWEERHPNTTVIDENNNDNYDDEQDEANEEDISSNDIDYLDLYKKKAQEVVSSDSSYVGDVEYSYAIKDIDFNNIPELIIYTKGECTSCKTFDFYTTKDGNNIKKLGSIEGFEELYVKDNQYYAYYFNHGVSLFDTVSVKNNKIVLEEISIDSDELEHIKLSDISDFTKEINKSTGDKGIIYNVVYYDSSISDKSKAVTPISYTDDIGNNTQMIDASTIKFISNNKAEINVNIGAGYEKQTITYKIENDMIYFKSMGDYVSLKIEGNKLLLQSGMFDLNDVKEFLVYEE